MQILETIIQDFTNQNKLKVNPLIPDFSISRSSHNPFTDELIRNKSLISNKATSLTNNQHNHNIITSVMDGSLSMPIEQRRLMNTSTHKQPTVSE